MRNEMENNCFAPDGDCSALLPAEVPFLEGNAVIQRMAFELSILKCLMSLVGLMAALRVVACIVLGVQVRLKTALWRSYRAAKTKIRRGLSRCAAPRLRTILIGHWRRASSRPKLATMTPRKTPKQTATQRFRLFRKSFSSWLRRAAARSTPRPSGTRPCNGHFFFFRSSFF